MRKGKKEARPGRAAGKDQQVPWELTGWGWEPRRRWMGCRESTHQHSAAAQEVGEVDGPDAASGTEPAGVGVEAAAGRAGQGLQVVPVQSAQCGPRRLRARHTCAPIPHQNAQPPCNLPADATCAPASSCTPEHLHLRSECMLCCCRPSARSTMATHASPQSLQAPPKHSPCKLASAGG